MEVDWNAEQVADDPAVHVGGDKGERRQPPVVRAERADRGGFHE